MSQFCTYLFGATKLLQSSSDNRNMRRSSRIQIKQEGSNADLKSEYVQSSRKIAQSPTKTIKVPSLKRNTRQKNGVQPSKPVHSKKRTVNNKPQNQNSSNHSESSCSNSGSVRDTPQPKLITSVSSESSNTKSAEKFTGDQAKSSRKSVKNDILLIKSDSNDSISSDVANTLKIDRTIKNLSPKKFFLNKDGKTTRSGRSFSPYDFASYALLFGSGSGQMNEFKPSSGGHFTETPITSDTKVESKQSKKSRKPKISKRGIGKQRSSKKSKKLYRRKFILQQPVFCEDAHEVVKSPVKIIEKDSFEKPYKRKIQESDDDLFSERVPAAFLVDIPKDPYVEGHSLPKDFWESSWSGWKYDAVDRKYEPKLDPVEMESLSKVSLADTEKYEFKSVFKDASSQMANFEDLCGAWGPIPAEGRFNVMEVESAEGKRFYRKKITDSRLIDWHNYNIESSTNYGPDADPAPTTRPVIRVRSNQCPRAEQVWKLSQSSPPPVKDVLNGPIICHPEPKRFWKLRNYNDFCSDLSISSSSSSED